jgi:hypothetical protein
MTATTTAKTNNVNDHSGNDGKDKDYYLIF